MHFDHHMDELLPPTLETLYICAPKLAVLDWLAELPYYRKELSKLHSVVVECSHWVGDGYEDLLFWAYPHPITTAFRSINYPAATLDIRHGWPGWCEEWNDYDLEVWELVRWMKKTFGPSFSGMSFSLFSSIYSFC
jgi:hypothetical protein